MQSKQNQTIKLTDSDTLFTLFFVDFQKNAHKVNLSGAEANNIKRFYFCFSCACYQLNNHFVIWEGFFLSKMMKWAIQKRFIDILAQRCVFITKLRVIRWLIMNEINVFSQSNVSGVIMIVGTFKCNEAATT